LRIVRRSDAVAIRALFERQGLDAGDLGVVRLVHFDPRSRYVLCVTGLIDGQERLLGVGAIEVGDREVIEPDLLLVEGPQRQQLGRLLAHALVQSAHVIARSRAA
jgi:hypothetical protein